MALGYLDDYERGDQAGDRIAEPYQGHGNDHADRDSNLGPDDHGPDDAGPVRREDRHVGSEARGVVRRQAEEERQGEQADDPECPEADGESPREALLI